jgi:RNA polymerase sigma-70 factor (ECF subfamily)
MQPVELQIASRDRFVTRSGLIRSPGLMVRTDAELLADDFGAFYERHLDTVTAYLARRTHHPEQTFDLVAEVFARALEHRRGYDPARGPAIAWLLGIARNLLLDAARRGRVANAARVKLGMAPIALDDEALERIEARGRIDVEASLALLQESQRTAIVRHVLEEEPYEAIAADVGCSESVIRQRVSRGLAALRRSL